MFSASSNLWAVCIRNDGENSKRFMSTGMEDAAGMPQEINETIIRIN